MSFARLPTQAPQFDATAFTKALQAGPITPALAKQFVMWKRWVEATTEYDAVGLRDTVNADALALNAVKADLDLANANIAHLSARVAALEDRPAVPFPGSS